MATEKLQVVLTTLHETARRIVLPSVHKGSGRISVSLTPSCITRGLDIEFEYRGGAQPLIVLPHL